jgi:hypothetical protein
MDYEKCKALETIANSCVMVKRTQNVVMYDYLFQICKNYVNTFKMGHKGREILALLGWKTSLFIILQHLQIYFLN